LSDDGEAEGTHEETQGGQQSNPMTGAADFSSFKKGLTMGRPRH
jgi:hypothetical protein